MASRCRTRPLDCKRWVNTTTYLPGKTRPTPKGGVEWDSAPATETLNLYAYKEGWCYSRQISIWADGQEHTITMQRALHVTGHVVDATTGDPIPTFQVVPGYGEGSGESVWNRSETAHATNGAFALDFKEALQPWRVKVEAEGYAPLVSDAIPPYFSETLVLQLKRADAANSVRGVVLLPDGKPAAGVEVAKLTLDNRVPLGNGRSNDDEAGQLIKTDEHGNFSFPADPRMHSVAAAGPEGFAKLRVKDASQPVTLRLQNWGRVEGTVAESERSRPIDNIVLMDDTAMRYQGSVTLDMNYFRPSRMQTGTSLFKMFRRGI